MQDKHQTSFTAAKNFSIMCLILKESLLTLLQIVRGGLNVQWGRSSCRQQDVCDVAALSAFFTLETNGIVKLAFVEKDEETNLEL